MATAVEPVRPVAIDAGRAGIDARVLAYVEEQTSVGETVHLKDVARACGTSVQRASRIIARLEARDVVVRMAGHDGWVAMRPLADTFASNRATLADLLKLAREKTDPKAVARRGRQAMHVSRDVDLLTPGQLADVERLVALVARHFPGANGDPAVVTDSAFSWEPSSNGGRGGWGLVERVCRWAEEEHRLKYEARQARLPTERRETWRPRLAADTVRDYQGAANNLLHLAATHGRIARSPLSGGVGGTLYAPCWAPIIDRWSRWLKRHGGASNPRRAFLGCRTLALYATRAGGRDVRTTNWHAVRQALHADLESGGIARWSFNAARYTWRAVFQSLGSRLGLDDDYMWPLQSDNRVALVPARAILTAAVADVASADRDFSGWVLPDGRFAAGLVEGRNGLRRWAAWSTLDDLLLRRQAEPLPPRVWAFASSVVDRRVDGMPKRVSDDTLQTRLRLFAYLAGYAARERRIDWTSADGLLTLADPDLVDAFVGWTLTLPEDRRGDRRSQLGQLVRTMAWLVNGFLAGQAELAGDRALVEQLRTWYHRLEAIAQEIPRPDHKDLRKVAAAVLATADGWKGSDGVDGIKKITPLIALLEQELVEFAGARSVDDQIAALAFGDWEPGVQWARTLRLIIALLIAQRVPLRGRTTTRLELQHWCANPIGAAQQHLARLGQLAPWEGALALDIPGRLMKSKRDFAPPLILPEHVITPDHEGSAAHEAAIRRDLLQLWFCPNGGRDVCCTTTDPSTGLRVRLDVPWLLPDVIGEESDDRASSPHSSVTSRAADRRGRKTRDHRHPGIWTRARLSAAFSRAVRRHAVELGINLPALKRIKGALGFHVVRRLFGSYWAPRNLLVTSRLLDHTKVTMTASIYCAQDVRTMSLDVAADD